MTIRFIAALTGSLAGQMRAETDALARGVTSAVRIAGAGLQSDYRRQTTGAGLGQRLANAWRLDRFPRSGDSVRAATVVRSAAPKLMQAFGDGVTIRSANGFFLAIPTDAAPKRGEGGKRISPSNWPAARFGPLRFVFRGRGRPGLLVVDGLRARAGKRGGFARGGKRATARGEVATVVMFILVPQARLRKRLDLDGPARAWQARLPELVEREWEAASAVAR